MDFTANIERFTGFADHYDRYRPAPPEALAELLGQFLHQERPGLVVDLGCGSGLSTRYWSGRAAAVIGVDPTEAMLAQARFVAGPEYRQGFSHATGLPEGGADIVTCSQSLHWMDPQPTFEEVARILRPGGVFAAYDYDWPPVTTEPGVDALYQECMERSRKLEKEAGVSSEVRQWGKSGHLARMQESGCFRFVRECTLHHTDEGNAERIVGLLLSQGHVQTLLKAGFTETDLRIDRLREIAGQMLGSSFQRWYWSSRVRVSLK
ncbi:MAG: methyltransferase type 11 [Verrucomicrobia bacterium 61-8]|nr:class I SAM-dependent methyltransferase [Verrucomicrobiota bacterium]OJU98975.1 MAG: methyltransferase type 11 [Verrucomicrobia bacterium 61-8]